MIDYELNVRYRSGVKPPCRYSTVWVQLGVRLLPWRASTNSTTTVTGKIFTYHLKQEGFQSNANRLLANSPAYVVSKFEHARGTYRQTENITFPQLRWQAVKIPEWLNKSDAVVDYRSTPKLFTVKSL